MVVVRLEEDKVTEAVMGTLVDSTEDIETQFCTLILYFISKHKFKLGFLL